MKNETSNPHESLWRRKTSPTGDKVAGMPADRVVELRLTEALGRLKDVPVPSNFTSRLMDEINRDEMREAAVPRWQWRWQWNLWPRMVGTASVLLLAAMLVQHHETVAHRAQLASTLAMVADVHTVPSVDALNNFEAIQAMSQPAHADEELLALAK